MDAASLDSVRNSKERIHSSHRRLHSWGTPGSLIERCTAPARLPAAPLLKQPFFRYCRRVGYTRDVHEEVWKRQRGYVEVCYSGIRFSYWPPIGSGLHQHAFLPMSINLPYAKWGVGAGCFCESSLHRQLSMMQVTSQVTHLRRTCHDAPCTPLGCLALSAGVISNAD